MSTIKTKRVLLEKVHYEEAPSNYRNTRYDGIKSKYTTQQTAVVTANRNNNTKVKVQQQKSTEQLPEPKFHLFARENIEIGWNTDRKWQVGAGMTNLGNTCYLNSILQALFHISAFVNWLNSDEEHRRHCEQTNNHSNCIICAMASTLKESQDTQIAIKPWPVYSRLHLVSKHLTPGRQEDAHEFLRYLIEAMAKSFIQRSPDLKDLDHYEKETTPLNQILGGYLRSSVRCFGCGHVSVTFQHFQDLLLDISKATSIEQALKMHFCREKLENMGYKCESCKKEVSVTKQCTLERPPVALCIQIKRFSNMGTKINKHLSFQVNLDLSKYTTKYSKTKLKYRLVALVSHLGTAQNYGHYTAIGLSNIGSYYNFDDSSVRPISEESVLATTPYLMFYELENDIVTPISKPTASPTTIPNTPNHENCESQLNGDIMVNNAEQMQSAY